MSLLYRQKIGAWVNARLARNPDALKIEADGLDLFIVRGVLDADDCAEMITYLEALFLPSEVLGAQNDPEFRTSCSANVDPWHPVVAKMEQRIHQIVGIQPELGEIVQGQRYHVGQQFKPHYDFFQTAEDYWKIEEVSGGQRTWTAMMYLNEPEAGGQTVFTEVDVSVRPRTGNLLVWNNLNAEGHENRYAKHWGSPVEAGSKYVLTKWYRERAWTPPPADVATTYY